MADTRKILKVFLASPGDLPDERRAAKSVVDEVNGLFANEFGYQIELVGWEDTISSFGRPQAIINAELERCEFFIGLMWKRWGTPPDLSGPYTSGFEEEFQRSVKRRLKEGRPEISILFKEIDPDLLLDPGDELKKVLAFKKQLIDRKIILYDGFSDVRDFETKVRRCLSKYVTRLRAQEVSELSDESQVLRADGGLPQTVGTTESAAITPLSKEGAKFLREFISKTEGDAKQEPIKTAEVARFRLLGSIIGNRGNDQRSLGVHDANILFAEGADFSFGYRELRGLLASGLEHFPYENVPIWRWLAALNGFHDDVLPFFALIETTEKRVGALSAMRLISEPLRPEPPLNRELWLNSWFSKDTANAEKVAALGYLGDLGVTGDIPTIRQELDRGDSQTTNAAIDAIIRIHLRESREKAVIALNELQPTSISQTLLAALFENGGSLSTDVLLEGTGHRNSKVRRIAAKFLRGRRALPNETAERLTTDNDAKVRYEALESLLDGGRTFSDAEAKNILVKPTPNSGIGLGLYRASDNAGEGCLERFRERRLRNLRDRELEEAAREESVLDRIATFILTDRQFSSRGGKLRNSVRDQFKAEFDEDLVATTEKFGNMGDLVEKTRSLEDFLRKRLTRKGLDVICRRGGASDLGQVREVVKSGFVEYSAADIEYLRRFGEWEDIPLRNSLLSFVQDSSKYRAAARAIYEIGRTRFSELLAIPAPGRLLAQLVVHASDKVFKALSDASIAALLRSEDDSVRKTTALKSVRALPKARVARILTDYLSADKHRYYNVVHWLDLGASAPRDRALSAVEKILNQEWRQ